LIDPRYQVIAYLLVALALRVVAGRLSTPRHGTVPWLERLTSGPPAGLLRFAYYVGLPYITLLLGVLPGRYLGLVGLERLASIGDTPAAGHPLAWLRVAFSLLLQAWLPDLGRLAGLSVLMAVLLAATWAIYRHYAPRNAEPRESAGTLLALGHPAPNPAAFARTAYAALHWSFYRAALWLITDDLYLAIFGGIVLVLLEAWLCREMDGRAAVDVSLLVATATIFCYVPNLWLLIPVHWLLAQLGWRIVAAGGPSALMSTPRRTCSEVPVSFGGATPSGTSGDST
jgi:hypothetical protein